MIQTLRNQESTQYSTGKIDKSKSFAFMSEHSNCFYIKAESVSAQQCGKISGYEKWHRRLGHTSNRDIHYTIPFVKGLEELNKKSYHQHTKTYNLNLSYLLI